MDIGNFMSEDNDELKPNLESFKQICRCCLTTETRMKNIAVFIPYFRVLADIHVSESDGLPQWLCLTCVMQLHKAVRFKQKVLRAHTLLNEYQIRCAPFPIDAQDPELHKYASPRLCAARTLCFDVAEARGAAGCHQVLQHKKQEQNTKLDTIEIPVLGSVGQDLKEEMGFSDYEDNITLEEFRSTATKLDEPPKLTEEDLQRLLQPGVDQDARGERRARHREGRKAKKRKRLAKAPTEIKVEDSSVSKKRLRASVELDPTKIRVLALNPEEQARQSRRQKVESKLPFQCRLCYASYNFEQKLQNHMRKHSPSRGPCECKLCSMYFPTLYSLSMHMLIHTTRYECLRCGRRMIDRYSIVEHYRSQHEGIVHVYTCEICGKQSSNDKTHRGHMRNRHSSGRPQCDLCAKSFVNKDALIQHMQIHEGIKNFECSTCGLRFRTNSQLKHHALSHSDVKAFYCVECDVRFKSASGLRGHLKKAVKHRDDVRFSYACSQCDKRYDVEKNLQNHIKVYHEGVREHACALCSASLASAGSLRKHMSHVHRGQRPPLRHVCDTCGKAFRGKSALTNHLRTHTGDKPFECPQCARRFAQRSSMRTHVTLVHLKLRRLGKTKKETPPALRFPKQEVGAGFDSWSREEPPCDVFFQVSAGS